MKKLTLIIAVLFLTFLPAQQLAFPSAYGAGAYVTGGRGLGVYHVTNLNDSGAGSLRQAVSDADSAGGGTIVFDVSGIIVITSVLGLTDNLTIAGQTAPEGGITIDGERVFVGSVDNLIVRHIRFKGGIDANNDSVTVRNDVTNQIWDHCSFAFGDDEGASWYETSSLYTVDNITVQRCLFGENSKGSIIGGETGGATTGDISFNYNLFYNTSHRFPNTSGVNANIEVINNVVWYVGSRMVRVNGAGQNLNHIGNYYHFTDTGIVDDRLHMFSYETGYPNIYTSGNKIEGASPSSPLTSTLAEMNADNTLAWKHFIDGTSTPQGTRNKGDQLEAEYFTDIQHSLLGRSVTILDADTAKTNVLADVGCNARLNADGSVSTNLDVEDADYINEINLGNYNTPLGSGSYNVTSFTSNSRPAGYDTDGDGMPNTWETANGLNPSVADNNGNDLDAGYTNLDMFLNEVDGTQTPVAVTNVMLSTNTLNMLKGTTYDIDVTFTPTNPTDKTGTWTSSNTSVATVDVNGIVTAVGEGTSSVYFTSNDGMYTDACSVTVTTVASSVTKKLKIVLISN